MSEWISVFDKLPELVTNIKAKYEGDSGDRRGEVVEISMQAYLKGKSVLIAFKGQAGHYHITHWQPLPELREPEGPFRVRNQSHRPWVVYQPTVADMPRITGYHLYALSEAKELEKNLNEIWSEAHQKPEQDCLWSSDGCFIIFESGTIGKMFHKSELAALADFLNEIWNSTP